MFYLSSTSSQKTSQKLIIPAPTKQLQTFPIGIPYWDYIPTAVFALIRLSIPGSWCHWCVSTKSMVMDHVCRSSYYWGDGQFTVQWTPLAINRVPPWYSQLLPAYRPWEADSRNLWEFKMRSRFAFCHGSDFLHTKPEYRVVRNRNSRLLFTSENRLCVNLHVQEQSTNMTSQCQCPTFAWRHRSIVVTSQY